MKLIIAGSRNIGLDKNGLQDTDYSIIDEALFQNPSFYISEVVSGMAKGVDWLGVLWAVDNKIPVKPFKPDWSNGKKAGILRNTQMGDYADALLAIWDGESKGTKHMIEYMKSLNKPVYIYTVAKPTEEVML